ncbi:helix-turn-helix domain-containing protein [Sphingomonas sp. BAUL-RG-20F-R05-02]|uniref:helix-turn-helix domain-containing protein n=1 Tax=Sphingomonas sp. BAUL-RG-20F-R05-02 TaxID=2914830 RepID=UPI001F55E70C|nr:helix-turn-helix domain-containing protein [Sphingomonas sp. BAUL-RG-20F-R05-02]
MDDDLKGASDPATRLGGAQAVARALDILDAIAERPMKLPELAVQVGLSTTTCYRLANALVSRGLLSTSGRSGYALGDRVAELGAALKAQRSKRAKG